MLCFTSIRSKVEYALPVSNSIASTDADKMEGIQQKVAVLCYNRFFPNSITFTLLFRVIKIAHLTKEEASLRRTLPYSSLP
jgi:hypothetical protein